jgi:hypothetical protein
MYLSMTPADHIFIRLIPGGNWSCSPTLYLGLRRLDLILVGQRWTSVHDVTRSTHQYLSMLKASIFSQGLPFPYE